MERGRRRLLHGLAGGVLAPMFSREADAAPQGATLDARGFGVRGDGVHDDTQALQSAIDALPASGGTLHIGPGRYLVDPVKSLRLRDRTRLAMADDAVLVAKPNDAPRAYVISIIGVSDVEVTGGRIVGDRDRHLSAQGEWGHGIMVRGARRVRLRGMHISRCWGDGISVGGISGKQVVSSRDVLIEDVVCADNRRQGLTIGRSQQVRVRRCEFVDTAGTLPACGIDIEPDPGAAAADILIEDCLMRGNHGSGLQIYRGGRGIDVRRCMIRGNRGDGVLILNGEDCLLEDNELQRNGLRGVAVRGASRGITLRSNRFSGNAAQLRERARGAARGWMSVDVARTTQSVRVERSNRFD